MILIPEDFFKKYISTRNDHDIYKLTKRLEKRVKKLEKYINKNKVCYEEINYESQLIKARQEYNYLNCIFLQKEFEIISYSESAIREIMDIIKDKKAYEIIDKKKLRYHPKVADLNKVIGIDYNCKENFELIKEKSIKYYTKEEVITRISYIYNQDFEGYDSYVSNIEDGTIMQLLERYLEVC